MIVRGVITKLQTISNKLGFSTAEVITNNQQNFDNIKRYQGYGFQSNPLPLEGDEGCEVLLADINQQRSVIAENDPRFRPNNTEEGSVQLYSNKKGHTFTLNPIKRVIRLLSGTTSITQDDTGLIDLKNEVAQIKMTLRGIQSSVGQSSSVMTPNSILDLVGSTKAYLTQSNYTIETPKFNITANDIGFTGKVALSNIQVASGVMSPDVKIGVPDLAGLEVSKIPTVLDENGNIITTVADLISTTDQNTIDTATAQATADLAYALADNRIVTYFEATEPTSGVIGDLWIRTTDGKMYRYDGTDWSLITDSRITDALADAGTALSASSTAQDTADSKIVSFFQDNQPTVGESSVGDLWVDTNDGNNLWRFNGSAWIDIADSGISTAISNAATAQSTGNFALSTANNALSTANTSYSLGSSVDSRTFGISYDSSGTVFAEKVNANVGFIANGVHGNNTTARFNTTGSANYGVTSQGTISGGVFTSIGSSSSAIGVQGVSNTFLGKGIQGTSTSGIGGELISSTGIGAKITNNTSSQSKPACQITNGNGSGIALSVSGKSKLGNTDVAGNLVVNTGTITGTFQTNSNSKVTNLNADYLDGWSHSSFPKTVTSSLAGSFSSANWPSIKYVRMNIGGFVRKVMVYDG